MALPIGEDVWIALAGEAIAKTTGENVNVRLANSRAFTHKVEMAAIECMLQLIYGSESV